MRFSSIRTIPELPTRSADLPPLQISRQHSKRGDAIIKRVHRNRNPEVARFLTGNAEDDSEDEDEDKEDGLVLQVQSSPKGGGDNNGHPETALGFSPPAAPEDPAEDEFFHKRSADREAEEEEDGKVGGGRHLHHRFVHFIEAQ